MQTITIHKVRAFCSCLAFLALPASAGASVGVIDPAGVEITFDPQTLARATRGTPLPAGLSEFDCSQLRLERSTVQDGAMCLVFVDPDRPVRRASLLLREGRLTGSIDHPDDLQERLVSRGAGRSLRSLGDTTRELPCGGPLQREPRDASEAAAPPVARLADGCDDGATLDIAAVYTPAAMAEAGSRAAVIDLIEWSIGDSNAIYLNSGIPITLRLVATLEATGYVESSWMGDDLEALTTAGDGVMDEAHTLRETVGADFVMLARATGGGACGVAWLLPDLSATDGSVAFSVTSLNCFTNRTVTHEIGHNMGCCHAPGDGGGCTTGGIFSYAVGHRFTGGDGAQYRTVMAYAPGTRIPYFSSATATFSGVTTGIADTRDNARTITETRMVTSNFRCEVTPSGAGSLARCWGANDRGQSTVASSLARVERVAAGSLHSVASLADGTVACWGSNDYGQCTPPATLPAVADVDAGVRHTMALTRGGAVVCWGANEYGQSTPPSGLGTVSSIASGGYHCLAILEIGSVRAWGQNNYGQATVPASVTSALSIGAGASHSLVVKADGSVAGWGRNDKAQASVPAGLAACTAVAGGDLHSLALRSTGTVAAWGNNPYGQCTVPADLAGVVAVAAGTSHSVALTSAGLVRGWGRDHLGQVTVPAGVEQITEIDSGSNHVIAVMRTADCNGNGVSDAFDIATGMSDADADGRIDACEMAQGDMDLSGEIDFGDVALVLLDYGPCAGCPSDLDGTGEVDFGDVGLVLLNFGPTS